MGHREEWATAGVGNREELATGRSEPCNFSPQVTAGNPQSPGHMNHWGLVEEKKEAYHSYIFQIMIYHYFVKFERIR